MTLSPEGKAERLAKRTQLCIEYIEKAGRPISFSSIALKAFVIDPNTATEVVGKIITSDSRFIVLRHGKHRYVWLDYLEPWTKPLRDPVSKAAKRFYTKLPSVEPRSAPVPPPTEELTLLIDLLRTKQPLFLEEVAKATKLPMSEAFKRLSNSDYFERDTNRLYWLAGEPRREGDGSIYNGYVGKTAAVGRWNSHKQSVASSE